MCQVVHKIIGNGSVRSGVSTLKQRLNVMERLGATRGCPPSPIRHPHSTRLVTFGKAKPRLLHNAFPRCLLWLCPSLLSSRKRQGRGRRKVEEMDKEVRRLFEGWAALPDITVRAQSVSHYQMAAAQGLVTLWATAAQRVSHEQSAPCTITFEWFLQKR